MTTDQRRAFIGAWFAVCAGAALALIVVALLAAALLGLHLLGACR